MPCWPHHYRVGCLLTWGSYSLHSFAIEVKSHQRNKLVYRCQVLGGKGCGKSSFVRGLVRKEQAPAEEELGDAVTVKAITLPESTSPIYLVVGNTRLTGNSISIGHFVTAPGECRRPCGCCSCCSWLSGAMWRGLHTLWQLRPQIILCSCQHDGEWYWLD